MEGRAYGDAGETPLPLGLTQWLIWQWVLCVFMCGCTYRRKVLRVVLAASSADNFSLSMTRDRPAVHTIRYERRRSKIRANANEVTG